MISDFDFFRTTMPDSRKADYFIGCLDSSVFIDFDVNGENLIALRRISFDGYGCCNVEPNTISLNQIDSELFRKEIEKEPFGQDVIKQYVLHLIQLNRAFLWEDVLLEYGLIEK